MDFYTLSWILDILYEWYLCIWIAWAMNLTETILSFSIVKLIVFNEMLPWHVSLVKHMEGNMLIFLLRTLMDIIMINDMMIMRHNRNWLIGWFRGNGILSEGWIENSGIMVWLVYKEKIMFWLNQEFDDFNYE